MIWLRNRLLWFVLLAATTVSSINISVDPNDGNDTFCGTPAVNSDIGETGSTYPCKTLNKALGNVGCMNITVNSSKTWNNLVVKLSDGVHKVGDCIAIKYSQNVTIEADKRGRTMIECGVFPSIGYLETGLLSYHTDNLTFRGIIFQHCGPHTPNVLLDHSSNILFEDCIFRNNIGATLRTHFVPSIIIRGTIFIDNFNQDPVETDTKNTILSDLFHSITTAGAFTYYSRITSVNIAIDNCTFINNTAGPNDSNDKRPILLKANGHGGGLLIRFMEVQRAVITISNSLFSGNHAEVDGGAIYLSLSKNFSSGQIILIKNIFLNNHATLSAGGAVSLNMFHNTFNNSFQIEDCIFDGNSAIAGGAFDVALYDSGNESVLLPNSAKFTNCSFTSNQASNEGTAVGLSALVRVNEFGFPVTFVNCFFENNTAVGSTSKHPSALVAFRFPTIFDGYNSFISNKGGGVALLNTILRASGAILFQSNSAMFGGGIAMEDRCQVEIHPNVNLTFINNTAEETGGALYVHFPAIRYTTNIFNRLCFIQYNDLYGRDLPPHLWENVTVGFYNNTARLSGAAIYASDMQLCSWLGPKYTTDTSVIFNYPEDANITTPFQYGGNRLRVEGQSDERLATAPHQVHVIPEYVLVQPGESVIVNILAMDQINNNREAIFSIGGPNGSPDRVDGLSTHNKSVIYQVPSVQNITGNESSCSPSLPFSGKFTLRISLLGTTGLVEPVIFNFSGCHPGYILDPVSCMCICDWKNPHILRCDSGGRYIFIKTLHGLRLKFDKIIMYFPHMKQGMFLNMQSSVWATERNDRKLITTGVQPSFVQCTKDGHLPGCLYQFDYLNAQCTEGREGILCGQCAEGYAVTLDLLRCTSADNQCGFGLIVLLILYGVVIVIALLALVFNREVPNELKGFIFYAQVIGLVYRPFVAIQGSESSIDPLEVFLNLLGFSLPLPICVSPALRAHHVALLGYITPMIGVTIVLGYAIGAQCSNRLSNHSALRGITFLSIFIYKYIADTSFTLLSCTLTDDYGLVFQYDGSLECTSIEFGLFVLFALIVLIGFVFPAPFAVGYICIKRPKRFLQYADVLTKGLKINRRWFGGYDIARRLPFVIISYVTVQAQPSLVLLLMALVAIAVLLIHLLSKPYTRNTVNIIEALILMDLVAVTIISLDPNDHPVPQWLEVFLFIAPYGYAVSYVTWIIGHYIWYLTKSKCMKSQAEILRDLSDPRWSPSNVVLQVFRSGTITRNDNTDCRTSKSIENMSDDGQDASCSHLREPLLDT